MTIHITIFKCRACGMLSTDIFYAVAKRCSHCGDLAFAVEEEMP